MLNLSWREGSAYRFQGILRYADDESFSARRKTLLTVRSASRECVERGILRYADAESFAARRNTPLTVWSASGECAGTGDPSLRGSRIFLCSKEDSPDRLVCIG